MKKFTLILSLMVAMVTTTMAQRAHQPVSHDNWVVTALNETNPAAGNEGGVSFIADTNTATFYHSNWASTYEGRTEKKGGDGIQAFMIELPTSVKNLSMISYTGRSDNNTSGWAKGVRIYVYEELPTGWPAEGLSSLSYEAKEELLKREENNVLGATVFDNYENQWATDLTRKYAYFDEMATGKYILFVQDAGVDKWLTCADFQIYTGKEFNAVENGGEYVLKITNSASGDCFVDTKTAHTDNAGNTIGKSDTPVETTFTLNNGHWHISSEAGYLGVSKWNAQPGEAEPTNWFIDLNDDGTISLFQDEYFGGDNPSRCYLGGDVVTSSSQVKMYVDSDKSKAIKIELFNANEAELIAAKNALNVKIQEAEAIMNNVGTNPGEYAENQVETLPAAIEAAQTVYNSGSSVVSNYETATETLDAAITALVLTPNPVRVGTYMIVSACEGFGNDTKALSCYGYDTKYGNHGTPAWAPINENDPLQYWTLEDNGDGKFNIKAKYEGSYINAAVNGLGATAKAATFTNLSNAQFNITLAGDTAPLHANGWNWGTPAGPLTTWEGGENTASAWKLVRINEDPAFTQTLTVGTAGWSTLMLGFDAVIPSGVTVMTVNSIESEYITLNEYTDGVLAANVAVLINAEAGDYAFVSTTKETTITESGFNGSLYRKEVTPNGTAYVLANDAESGVGLYKAELNKAESTAFINNANKAYLVVPTEQAQGVASYSFRFGEGTTGVDEITDNRVQSTEIYDLTGRRIEEITAPGIYIVGGVKRVIR